MNVLNSGLHVGAVIIGRNEGQRLITCLESLLNIVEHIIYVDSGSSDNSLQEAKNRGVYCLSLDETLPFTAARARNKGANHLIQNYPCLKYIQFIDGDCEIQPDWVNKAQNFLEENSQYAVACGRRRERFPDQSIYNQLCDIEWNTFVGDAKACGGDALIRVDAFKLVNGYRDDVIAGEEPEMCFRLREKGWKIRRIDAEMVLHDAAITQFSQWWKRTVRSGYAFALGCSIHGRSKERYSVKESQRIVFWGIVLPCLIMVLSISNPEFIGLFFIYFVQVLRISLRRPSLGLKAIIWSSSLVFGKFPEAVGFLKFWKSRVSNTNIRIIEYK